MSDNPLSIARVKSLARAYTENALTTLHSIMMEPECPPAARVKAAEVILDRGWGKASQPVQGDDDNPVRVIHQIERTVVYPQIVDLSGEVITRDS